VSVAVELTQEEAWVADLCGPTALTTMTFGERDALITKQALELGAELDNLGPYGWSSTKWNGIEFQMRLFDNLGEVIRWLIELERNKQ